MLDEPYIYVVFFISYPTDLFQLGNIKTIAGKNPGHADWVQLYNSTSNLSCIMSLMLQVRAEQYSGRRESFIDRSRICHMSLYHLRDCNRRKVVWLATLRFHFVYIRWTIVLVDIHCNCEIWFLIEISKSPTARNVFQMTAVESTSLLLCSPHVCHLESNFSFRKNTFDKKSTVDLIVKTNV